MLQTVRRDYRFRLTEKTSGHFAYFPQGAREISVCRKFLVLTVHSDYVAAEVARASEVSRERTERAVNVSCSPGGGTYVRRVSE